MSNTQLLRFGLPFLPSLCCLSVGILIIVVVDGEAFRGFGTAYGVAQPLGRWPCAMTTGAKSYDIVQNDTQYLCYSFLSLFWHFLSPCLGVNFLINSPSLDWPRKNASLNWPKVSWPIRPYPDIKFVTLIISIVELINLLLLVLDKIWLTSLGLDSMISKCRNGNPNGAITMSLYLRERFIRNTTEFKLKLEI